MNSYLEKIKEAAFIDELQQSEDGVHVGIALGLFKSAADDTQLAASKKQTPTNKPVQNEKPVIVNPTRYSGDKGRAAARGFIQRAESA